ncbi:MAG TPA: hypothetical protein VJ792_06180, partial [Candidatus Nitrosotalea sp.]|nr:hypothetical protein [Candidatus Nitrosotalea sp.]
MSDEGASEKYSVTFRLDNAVLNRLRTLAKHEGISLNTLANQVFRNFVEWDATATKAGWLVFHKTALREIINSVDEDTLEKLAVQTADYVKDVTLIMSERHDLESYLSMLRNRAKKSGFVLIESHRGPNKRLILQHDMGKNWSSFFKAHYERMLQNLGFPAKFEQTDNT